MTSGFVGLGRPWQQPRDLRHHCGRRALRGRSSERSVPHEATLEPSHPSALVASVTGLAEDGCKRELITRLVLATAPDLRPLIRWASLQEPNSETKPGKKEAEV